MNRTVTAGDPIVFVNVDGQPRHALVTTAVDGATASMASCVIVDEAGMVLHRSTVKHMGDALPGEIYWRLPTEHAATGEQHESVALPSGRYAHKDNAETQA